MSQLMIIVEAAKNGSMHAELGSGISVMSDSWIALQPAIEEPSNISPSTMASSSNKRLIEGHVLPLAARIGKAQIDIFDVVVLDRLQDILGGLHDLPFLKIKVRLFPPAAGSDGWPFDQPPKWL